MEIEVEMREITLEEEKRDVKNKGDPKKGGKTSVKLSKKRRGEVRFLHPFEIG